MGNQSSSDDQSSLHNDPDDGYSCSARSFQCFAGNNKKKEHAGDCPDILKMSMDGEKSSTMPKERVSVEASKRIKSEMDSWKKKNDSPRKNKKGNANDGSQSQSEEEKGSEAPWGEEQAFKLGPNSPVNPLAVMQQKVAARTVKAEVKKVLVVADDTQLEDICSVLKNVVFPSGCLALNITTSNGVTNKPTDLGFDLVVLGPDMYQVSNQFLNKVLAQLPAYRVLLILNEDSQLKCKCALLGLSCLSAPVTSEKTQEILHEIFSAAIEAGLLLSEWSSRSSRPSQLQNDLDLY